MLGCLSDERRTISELSSSKCSGLAERAACRARTSTINRRTEQGRISRFLILETKALDNNGVIAVHATLSESKTSVLHDFARQLQLVRPHKEAIVNLRAGRVSEKRERRRRQGCRADW